MFKNQSLFVLVDADGGKLKILRVETTKEAQTEVCDLLNSTLNVYERGKDSIEFNGSYKPEQNEILVIKEFDMDKHIIEAVKNPIGIAMFVPDSNNPPTIKAFFMGEYTKKSNEEKYIIAFQKFRKEQYITRKGLNLFHDANTFSQEKRFGICITDTLDCVVINNELRFTSFYYARQIFDLSEYYREATDSDVDEFINHSKINVENADVFKSNADSWVRRKVALISDSGIFSKYSPKQIKEKAKNFGLVISTTKNKLSLPNNKKELKVILKFLDNEIYKGVFSEEILQTNSKRKAEI